MIRFHAALLACCLAAPFITAAQMNSSPVPLTEQVETGTITINVTPQSESHSGLSGAEEGYLGHYRIRLLPIPSFPQLPAQTAQQLTERGCMIPQTYEAREPENVIHGTFEKLGSNDWAVLCSVNRVTTLYVFFQSDLARPIPLRHQPDSQWLGVEWSLDYGSAWGIAACPSRLMPGSAHANHDGIEDAFVEHSSTIHYFENGRWTTIDSSP
ncbi:MAG TPA: hypothetical protein VFW25_03955 [Silvibacterium sp.]|nr:hypothetical protein [Silvibacterium sp.]